MDTVEEQLYRLGHCVSFVNITSGHHFGGLWASAPTTALARDRTGAALARSKALNHFPANAVCRLLHKVVKNVKQLGVFGLPCL